MSPTEKRDAQEAFGEDGLNEEARANKKKKSRSKRTKLERERASQQYKQKSRRQKAEKEIDGADTVSVGQARQDVTGEVSLSSQASTKVKKRRPNLVKEDTTKWRPSKPRGGRFIDHPPLLRLDQQFIVLATKHDIQIYSSQTSLLVRTVQITDSSSIIGYQHVKGSDDSLVVATDAGDITLINWTSGRSTRAASTSRPCLSIVCAVQNEIGVEVMLLEESVASSKSLSMLQLDTKGKLPSHEIISTRRDLESMILAFPEFGMIVAATREGVMISRKTSEDKHTYVSDIIEIGKRIMTLDAYVTATKQSQKDIRSTAWPKPAKVTLAVGLVSGEVQLYSDIQIPFNHRQSQSYVPRKLHWHRSAAHSIKFTPDGTYLVSGGEETVLVIWQLSTGNKQTLPHLLAPIQNISISFDGSAYALQLADNSVMVISTSDLQPFANVSGIALNQIATTTGTECATTHPQHQNRLLLAHSTDLRAQNANQKQTKRSSTVLQTYDCNSATQLQSQALARNLASIVDISPSGDLLQEPNVTNIVVTHDGKWLVTADTWSPNKTDLNEQYLDRADKLARTSRDERHLRFWSNTLSGKKDEQHGSEGWEMNTRIDDPVNSSAVPTAKARLNPSILSLSSNPTKQEVVVADGTRALKLYSPKARVRSGVPVRGADGAQLFTWTLDHEIHLAEFMDPEISKSASLAYSSDGSILAVAFTSATSTSSRVHLVNPRTAEVVASLPNLLSDGRPLLAFCGRYLVCLSRKVVVFDTISGVTVLSFDLHSDFDQSRSFLAANERSSTVAVCTTYRENRDKNGSMSRIVILACGNEQPGLAAEFGPRCQVRILLADSQSRGFLVVDDDGRTSNIQAPGNDSSMTEGLITNNNVISQSAHAIEGGLSNVFGKTDSRRASEIEAKMTDSGASVIRMEEEAGGSTQKRGLEDVLKFASSTHVPDVKVLFDSVARIASERG